MDYKTEISKFLDAQKNNMVMLLQKLASIPSVLGDASENMPFGKDINDVLELTLSEAEALGLKAYCFENRADIVKINDKEPKLTILSHLDVVPATPEGWNNPPFKPTVAGDMIYGRGVSDNKGPSVAALYALYAIKSLGIELKNDAMLYLGGCEESGCRDLTYYLKNNTLSEYVFTPDACFPVGNAERGRIVLTSNTEFKSDKIVSIEAGKGVNIIPDFAQARLKNVALYDVETLASQIDVSSYTVSKEQGEIVLTMHGESTHAAHPSWGLNALTALIDVLGRLDENIKPLANHFPHKVFGGEGLGLDGGLDISITQLKIENGKMFLTADGRVDLGVSSEKLATKIKKNISYPIELLVKEPHYVDENADIVKKLNKVYEEYTPHKGGIYTLDAMTYAHSVDGAVIFGGVLPGDGCANAHGVDECYNLDTLVESAKIFAGAILEICEVEE